MTNPLLRILMAAYLAIWSPAVCCCAIKAAMGRVTGAEIVACAGKFGSTAMRAQEELLSREVATQGCCAHEQPDGLPCHEAGAGDPAGEEPAPSPPSQPCRCHESKDANPTLDTGLKVAAPLPAKSAAILAMHMPPGACMLGESLVVVDAARSHQRERDLPPPHTTLLAQRCLLLI